MARFGFIDTYLVYSFLKRLVKPYENWDAFKTGVIDKDGNIIVASDKRTSAQKESFKMFDLLVMNLKKILSKIPGGSSKLATLAAAVFLLKENLNDDQIQDMAFLEESLKEFITESDLTVLQEEIANTVGAGNIAGANGDPPRFAGHRVFDVDTKTYWKSRYGKKPYTKYKKYLDEEDEAYGEEIRSYCRSNPKESIVVRDKSSGAMMFLRRKHK